jgi:hypothetical protein
MEGNQDYGRPEDLGRPQYYGEIPNVPFADEAAAEARDRIAARKVSDASLTQADISAVTDVAESMGIKRVNERDNAMKYDKKKAHNSASLPVQKVSISERLKNVIGDNDGDKIIPGQRYDPITGKKLVHEETDPLGLSEDDNEELLENDSSTDTQTPVHDDVEDTHEEEDEEDDFELPVIPDGDDPLASLRAEAGYPHLEYEEDNEVVTSVTTEEEDDKEPFVPVGKITRRANTDLGFTIDLDNLTLIETDAVSKEAALKDGWAVKDTIQVVLTQSGYSVEMSALSMAEIQAIQASSTDVYTEKFRLLRTAYDHIEHSSLGKFGFQDWLKFTSYYDLNTLYYGMYCMTFPDKNPFDIACGSCGKDTSIEVDNSSLIQTPARPSAITAAKNVAMLYKDPKAALKAAQLQKPQKLLLPESKLVLGLRNPTLEDYLDLVRMVTPQMVRDSQKLIGMMLFTKIMLKIDIRQSRSEGKAISHEIDRDDWFETLNKVSIIDGRVLQDKLDEMSTNGRVDFAIRSCNCMHCEQTLPEIPIDIENVLFVKIAQEAARQSA